MQEPRPWKKLSSRSLLSDPLLSIQEDTVQLPNGKQTRYVMHRPTGTHSVIVIAVNEKGEILLQREFSYPPNIVMWQLPGGAMNKGESPVEAAQRELAEESGYNLEDAEEIGYFYVSNRRSNRKQYIITGQKPIQASAAADDDEFIYSEWVNLAKIKTMIGSGDITNINLLAALQIWELKKGRST